MTYLIKAHSRIHFTREIPEGAYSLGETDGKEEAQPTLPGELCWAY